MERRPYRRESESRESEDSVGEHLTAIYGKLGAVNRAEAIVLAIRRQLLKI